MTPWKCEVCKATNHRMRCRNCGTVPAVIVRGWGYADPQVMTTAEKWVWLGLTVGVLGLLGWVVMG